MIIKVFLCAHVEPKDPYINFIIDECTEDHFQF